MVHLVLDLKLWDSICTKMVWRNYSPSRPYKKCILYAECCGKICSFARETHKDTAVSVWACQAGFWKSTGTSCQLRSGMDPSTEPTRSPISTNQRREMLLFLARIFGSHAGITNNGSAHTDSVRFCRFWFSRPRVKWLYGCLQGNRLRTISNSNLRIKLRHHWQNLGFVLSSFSPSVTLLSFFVCIALSASWCFSPF